MRTQQDPRRPSEMRASQLPPMGFVRLHGEPPKVGAEVEAKWPQDMPGLTAYSTGHRSLPNLMWRPGT